MPYLPTFPLSKIALAINKLYGNELMILCLGMLHKTFSTYVISCIQDKAVEAKVYEQMSLVSCVMGFSWSKWSNEVGEQQFVVKACECVTQQVSTSWATRSLLRLMIVYMYSMFFKMYNICNRRLVYTSFRQMHPKLPQILLVSIKNIYVLISLVS